MRLKAELHPDVAWYLRQRHRYHEEINEFYRQLEAIRTEPIKNSEAISDPRLSRYMLRFFRFGMRIAIFEFDPAENRIRVLECRTLKSQQKRKNGKIDPEKAS